MGNIKNCDDIIDYIPSKLLLAIHMVNSLNLFLSIFVVSLQIPTSSHLQTWSWKMGVATWKRKNHFLSAASNSSLKYKRLARSGSKSKAVFTPRKEWLQRKMSPEDIGNMELELPKERVRVCLTLQDLQDQDLWSIIGFLDSKSILTLANTCSMLRKRLSKAYFLSIQLPLKEEDFDQFRKNFYNLNKPILSLKIVNPLPDTGVVKQILMLNLSSVCEVCVKMDYDDNDDIREFRIALLPVLQTVINFEAVTRFCLHVYPKFLLNLKDFGPKLMKRMLSVEELLVVLDYEQGKNNESLSTTHLVSLFPSVQSRKLTLVSKGGVRIRVQSSLVPGPRNHTLTLTTDEDVHLNFTLKTVEQLNVRNLTKVGGKWTESVETHESHDGDERSSFIPDGSSQSEDCGVSVEVEEPSIPELKSSEEPGTPELKSSEEPGTPELKSSEEPGTPELKSPEVNNNNNSKGFVRNKGSKGRSRSRKGVRRKR